MHFAISCTGIICFHAKQSTRAVLLTDTRDVIFQGDPFSFSWGAGLNVTLEDKRMRIRDCPYMTRWVGNHLGEQALCQIEEEYISCSGTTLGDHQTISWYLEQMTALLAPYTPGERMAGYDQGVHNFLLYTKQLHHPEVHDNCGTDSYTWIQAKYAILGR